MPRYFFDIKDGHSLVDTAGRECKNDTAAKDIAEALAIVVSIDTPAVDPWRVISVRNEARQEIYQAAVYSKPVAADGV
jgi:ADP-ribose pyrophosphatase YjhB (NUDIX family)